MSKFTDLVKTAAAYISPAYAMKYAADKEINTAVDLKMYFRESLYDIEGLITSCNNAVLSGTPAQRAEVLEELQDSVGMISGWLETIDATSPSLSDALHRSIQAVERDLISLVNTGERFDTQWSKVTDAIYVVCDVDQDARLAIRQPHTAVDTLAAITLRKAEVAAALDVLKVYDRELGYDMSQTFTNNMQTLKELAYPQMKERGPAEQWADLTGGEIAAVTAKSAGSRPPKP